MNRPRLIRWLRIAVSTVCVVVFVALIGLWVRSYTRMNAVIVGVKGRYEVDVYHNEGLITAYVENMNGTNINYAKSWIYSFTQNEPATHFAGAIPKFSYIVSKRGVSVSFPYWIPVAVAVIGATLAAFPWKRIRFQFSLRTMLLVTALVAMALGFVVWMSR